MANNCHLLLNIRGDYTPAGLAAETWQIGVRWRASNTMADPVGSVPTDFAPIAATINRDETDWLITGNWFLQGPTTSTVHPDDWLNDQVAPAIAAWWGTTRVSSQCRIVRLDVYPIGNNGKAIPAPPYAGGSPVSLVYKAGQQPVGAGGGNLLPPQVSIVASLRTQQIGRRGRGRVYLPPTGVGIAGSDGRVASTQPAPLAGDVSQFLTDCTVHEALTEVFIDPIVTGAPYSDYAVINQVRVGDVFDTQRRRRRNLTEAYANVAVPHP